MSLRLHLRSPFGRHTLRDISDGVWAEPAGATESTFGDDLWALPGLVDAHAHIASPKLEMGPGSLELSSEVARETLRAGVTLIIDKGWSDDTVMRVVDAVPKAERPEIEAAALMVSVPGGYYEGFGGLVIDPADIAITAEGQAREGAGWVKLIGDWPRRGVGPVANFTESQLRLAVQVATENDARVAIHTMARETPSIAVAAGVHSIEHGLFLTKADIGALGARHGIWVPTIGRMEQVLALLGAESSGGRLIAAGLKNIAGLLPIAQEAGVHVLAGTDLVGTSATVAAEALRLKAYGMTNGQALEATVFAGFHATGRSSEFEIGSSADAVLYPENPLVDLGVLSHPKAVFRHGVRI